MKDEDEEIPEEFSDEEVTNILKEALTFKIKEKRKKPNKIQINQAMISVLGEFLACYKIIGYDLNGDPINMTIYKEKIEKSALDNLFLEQISKFMSSRLE
jgi:uncharacterized protein (UPF0297 family)